MSVGKGVAVLFLVGCGGSHDGKRSDVTAPSVFLCQRAAVDSGVRTCVGSGRVPAGESSASYFSAADAWCFSERASMGDPRSRMTCVATKDECARELLRHNYARSGCTRTLPQQWTAAETDFSHPDLFACQPDVFATAGDPNTHRCLPFSADSLAKMDMKDSSLSAQAWCFEAPGRGAAQNVLCFRSQDECARRAHMDPFADGACTQQDARAALVALYGSSPEH